MPLDTGIIRGLDFGPSYNQQQMEAMQLQQGMNKLQQDAMAQRQAQQAAQQAAMEEQAIKQAYGKYAKPDGSLDQQGFLSEIGRINPNKAMEFQTKFDAHNKFTSELRDLDDEHLEKFYDMNKRELELNDLRNATFAPYLKYATNPEQYQAVVAKARELGIGPDQVPDQFDPDVANKFMLGVTAQKAKDAEEMAQWEKGLKEREQTRKEKADAEAKRANIADEEIRRYTKIKEDKSQLEGIDPDTNKPYTAAQNTAAGYALRAVEASSITDKLYKEGFDAGKISNAVMKPDKLNIIKDPEQRQYAQAARNFINSILRPESGAVIAESEFRDAYKQYFPQPGDDQATQEQKRMNRLQKIAGLKASAGNAYERVGKEYETLKGAVAPSLKIGETMQHSNGVTIQRLE